jgi:hypothetical protein
MPIEEYCEKCNTKMTIVIDSSSKDVINYHADCPLCHQGLSRVIFPNQIAPVICLDEDVVHSITSE